jgi:hypothetical protein
VISKSINPKLILTVRHYNVRAGSLLTFRARSRHFRFSNRPFRVKLLQTIHHYSVDVAHGLALLFGFGTKALPAWDSKTRWKIYAAALPLD